MATVLQFNRRLDSKPEIASLPGIYVRPFEAESDIPAWLELRHQSFARQRIGVRQWSVSDFHREFTNRWWWNPEHMWLAESVIEEPSLYARVPGQSAPENRLLVGAVTLAMRGDADQIPHARPVVHWLLVHPRWRRRGLGRLLMAHLESAVWDAGYRQLWLETHAAWDAAVKFYQSLGYRDLTSQQSRFET